MKKLLSLLTITTLATTAATTTVACGNHNHTKEKEEIIHHIRHDLYYYANYLNEIWPVGKLSELNEEKLKWNLWTGVFSSIAKSDLETCKKQFNDQNVKDNLIIHNFKNIKLMLERKPVVLTFELETLKNINSKINVTQPNDYTLLKSGKTNVEIDIIYDFVVEG